MNTSRKIGVGVIGASPLAPGWAVAAHLPAIKALPDDFELRAVSTSRPESAKAAAEAFGVPGYHELRDLLADPGVDLIVVAVKVPHHHEVIAAALAAGKMVLSEWPLGNGLSEAVDLAARAKAANVRTAIGLQARFAPAIREARRLVADGHIGEVLGTTLVGSGIAWGGVSDGAHAYMFDAANGATVLTVPVLHALDGLHHVLGEFAEVSATAALRRPTVLLADAGTHVQANAPDHIAITGTLQSGALASIFYRGGVSRGDNLRWEINGSLGDLVITSAVGNLQVADLTLWSGRGEDAEVSRIELSDEFAGGASGVEGGIGANVRREYAALARDLREGTREVPDFDFAVRRHRLLASIEEAARSGVSQRVA